MDESVAERIKTADPEAAAVFENMLAYQAVRTHFFDAFFADAVAAGIRQVVILASGLDARAYRLQWPAGTVVFEIDQPKVLEYKSATLPPMASSRWSAATRWPSTFDRTGRRIDGRGFRPDCADGMVGEGLLMYLPAEAQDNLFTQITELSAPGSRVSAEAMGHRDENAASRCGCAGRRWPMRSVWSGPSMSPI